MTSDLRRTAAVAPDPGYSRPPTVGPDGFSVSVRTEDGIAKDFDFSSTSAPPDLVKPLVAAFAKVSGPAGTWRQSGTVYVGQRALLRFLRFVAEEHPNAVAVADVTAEVWTSWREHAETGSGWNSAARALRTLLRETDGLPARTRMALNGRLEGSISRQMIAYRRDELAAIVRAARRVLAGAANRISANREALDRYRAGLEPADCMRVRFPGHKMSSGEILDHLSRTGRMPHPSAGPAQGDSAALKATLGLGEGPRYYRPALFPELYETYAAMILLTYTKGLNPSVMTRLKASDIRRHPGAKPGRWIYQMDLDKPRRGQDRESNISFAGAAARLLERVIDMGEPARDTLAQLGVTEAPLLIACQKKSHAADEAVPFCSGPNFISSASRAWHQRVHINGGDVKTLRVNLSRVRLSVQVIRGEAMGNSTEVSVGVYRGPDPQTHEQARPVVVQGLNDALADAKRRVAARISASEAEAARIDPAPLAARLRVAEEVVLDLLEGRLDTAVAACLDIMHSPHEVDGSGPCTASFLTCVECPNAVAMPDRIPRIVATREALAVAARSAPPAVQQRRYARHLAAFDDLLSQMPEPELRRSLAAVSPADVEAVAQLLDGNLDS